MDKLSTPTFTAGISWTNNIENKAFRFLLQAFFILITSLPKKMVGRSRHNNHSSKNVYKLMLYKYIIHTDNPNKRTNLIFTWLPQLFLFFSSWTTRKRKKKKEKKSPTTVFPFSCIVNMENNSFRVVLLALFVLITNSKMM